MRVTPLMAIGLIVGLGAVPAHAEDFAGLAAVPLAELDGQRGGSDTGGAIDLASLSNQTSESGSNVGNVSVSGNSLKASGEIGAATVTANHGITTLIQNTGDMVNMNNATSVNVYLK